MSKTYRLNFEKGINVVGDKAILPDGFVTIADNVDLRSGSPRPFKAPEYQFPVASTTSRSWSYRGRWFHSTNWRDYVGEYVGGIERVYASEEGVYPSKFIGGTQVSLGTLVPQMAPSVNKVSTLSPSALIATVAYGNTGNLPVGERLYRVSARTADGILPPTAPISVTIAPVDATHTGPSVTLTWGAVPKATGYIVFQGPQSGQLRLDEVTPGTLSYTDNGSKTAAGDNASQYLQEQEFEYAYTYKRNVNQVFDEGGLSGPSIPMSAATGRRVTRDFLNDGFFSQLLPDGTAAVRNATGTIAATSAVAFPALVLSEAASVASTALVVGRAYKILTVGGADYKTVGAADNQIGTRFYATGTSAGGAGTVIQSVAFYDTTLLMTKFNYLNHGLVSDDKVQFQGFTDTVWNNQTYDVIYIDANNFAIKNVKAPTDASPWAAAHLAQPQKSSILLSPVAATSLVRGYSYTITVAGTTDFTLVGAANSTVGTVFTATGFGTGTGTATPVAPATGDAVYLVGSGTGQSVASLYKATNVDGAHFTVPLLASQTAGSIALSTIQWIPLNNYYDKWELYRNEQGIWNLVEELDIWVSSFTDAKPFAALGGTPTSFYTENGITIDYQPAPLGLTNFESHYGMLFGVVNHTIRWTPILTPDAWPEVLGVTMAFKPVALASYGQGLIIMCEDAIYRLDGNTATGMSLSKTHAEDGCFAPHSVQKTDRGLLYLSKRGIMIFNGTHAECITDTRLPGTALTAPSRLATAYPFWWMPTIMTRNYADLAGEESIKGSQYVFNMDNTRTIEGYNKYIKSFYHLGKYYIFYAGDDYAANTAFVVDLQAPGLPITTLGMKALDAHVDEFENAYVLLNNAAPVTTVTITSPA